MQPEDSGTEILVVEDSPTQALKLQRLLTRPGSQVAIARNGPEALASLARRAPALVLCDIGLSGMDGYELCRQIKAPENFPEVPVILLTSFLDPLGAIRALQCGADNLLPRVFDAEALLSRLDDIRANLGRPRCPPGAPDVDVRLDGRTHRLPPECGPQALDLLVSAYQVAVQRSLELRQARETLERQAEELEQRRGAALPPSPAPPSPAAGPRGRRVLLAEDSEVNQRLAARTLERRGFDVVVTGNGLLALAAWEREPFDLILMDVEMPEMNGWEATAAIRDRERGTGAHIPIIAMTAHDRPEDLNRCLESGMDGYTAKPLRVDALLAAIERFAPPPGATVRADP